MDVHRRSINDSLVFEKPGVFSSLQALVDSWDPRLVKRYFKESWAARLSFQAFLKDKHAELPQGNCVDHPVVFHLKMYDWSPQSKTHVVGFRMFLVLKTEPPQKPKTANHPSHHFPSKSTPAAAEARAAGSDAEAEGLEKSRGPRGAVCPTGRRMFESDCILCLVGTKKHM